MKPDQRLKAGLLCFRKALGGTADRRTLAVLKPKALPQRRDATRMAFAEPDAVRNQPGDSAPQVVALAVLLVLGTLVPVIAPKRLCRAAPRVWR